MAESGWAIYDRDPDGFVRRYEANAFQTIHDAWLAHLPASPGAALDVGAGSGRDAAALAELGWEVHAVEPAARLRRLAAARHPSPRIRWLEDHLPELAAVRVSGVRFDLVLVSAVWMHVPVSQAARSLRKLADLLRPGGLLVVTAKVRGAADGQRDVPAEEVVRLGRDHALEVVMPPRLRPDAEGRAEVTWATTVLRLPDDGTGALPVLRHVIVNDDKTATYKLALLRALLRIADGAAGMVRWDDGEVGVPMGLVALFWARLFHPLLLGDEALPQAGQGVPLRFDKPAFRALREVRKEDLQIGARFTGPRARLLGQALADCRATILRGPVRYITRPGTDDEIFRARGRMHRPKRDAIVIDRDTMYGFGELLVPRVLWEALGRHACWIEPAVVHEWARQMQRFDERERPVDAYLRALAWSDPERRTSEVRALLARLLESGEPIPCAWSGRSLRALEQVEIDHVFPFAHWPNNDLWNLTPVSKAVNNHKRDRLPTAEALDRAAARLTEWWERAYWTDRRPRFEREARASLPAMSPAPELAPAVLDGMQAQRLRLRVDQQLEEWFPPVRL